MGIPLCSCIYDIATRMDFEQEALCHICNEIRADLNHNNTLNHRYHFATWAYTNYRKALTSDRHGVVIEAHAQKLNNFNFDFYDIQGKYITKVAPEQLRLHNREIQFNCKIVNKRKDDIYVTSVNLLHPSEYFRIQHSVTFGETEETYIMLKSGLSYKFQVYFQAQLLHCASYKIPLACCFQTTEKEYKQRQSFTIVRTFLTLVDDAPDTEHKKLKSPFTSKQWKDDKKIVPTTKEVNYTDEYPIPPQYIRILTYGLQRFEGMTYEDELNWTDLTQSLRRLAVENYAKFWHILLWLEEHGQALMLMKYNMQGVIMKILNEEILVLEVPGLAEKRPSVIVGDFIKIRITGDHTAYMGFVGRVNDTTIEISHVDEELLDYIRGDPFIEMDVAFMLSRLAFERMHKAVDKLMINLMVSRLFPPDIVNVELKITHKLKDIQFYNKSICDNEEQRNAVENILNTTHTYPYIVFGPPGTGKTVTIVEAILQLKKRTNKRILVCAPANAACDMLAERLIPFCTKDELIRIHSSTRERTTITEKLKEYSNIEDDEFLKIDLGKLVSCRIVVATLTLIGRFNDYHPDCVFIDEAAQALEPESDIAIGLIGFGKQVVLAGDPKQLGPMATKSAEKFGLGVSLLERLMNYKLYSLNPSTQKYDTNFITMLKLNFRSHPDILLLPNELFYDNLLQPVSKIPLRDPIASLAIYPSKNNKKIKGPAIEFCSVSAKEKREGSSPSYFNLFEAKMVLRYVEKLHNLEIPEVYKVRSDQIGVVTPYKRQVFKIREALTNRGFGNVEVGTTESFQGREKRIIILSTVRAQHSLLLHDKKYKLGFVKNDQRFNVAVTRAISKLIVVGCPLVLQTDDKWLRFMDLCRELNSWFGNLIDNHDAAFRQDVLARMRKFKYKDEQYG